MDDTPKNLEEVGAFSPDELKRLKEVFASNLAEYQAKERRYAVPILLVFVAGFAAVFCSFLLFHPPVIWLFVAGLCLILAGVVFVAIAGSIVQKYLTCPGCQGFFIDHVDEHCPECGSSSLESKNWRSQRLCRACGKKLSTGKRNFKYRACTHCGMFLCEKGL